MHCKNPHWQMGSPWIHHESPSEQCLWSTSSHWVPWACLLDCYLLEVALSLKIMAVAYFNVPKFENEGMLKDKLQNDSIFLFQVPTQNICLLFLMFFFHALRLPSWDVNFPFAWKVNASRIHVIGRIQRLRWPNRQSSPVELELELQVSPHQKGNFWWKHLTSFFCKKTMKVLLQNVPPRRPLQYAVAALLHPESGSQGKHHDGEVRSARKKLTL